MNGYVYNQPCRPQLDVSGDFTRNHPEYDTEAERICRELIAIVNDLGDSPALSRAVTVLDQARHAFADHVERVDHLTLRLAGPGGADPKE